MSNFSKGSPERPVVFLNRHPRRPGALPEGPDTPNQQGKGGGTRAHKNPECPCPPCRARRRKAQTLALAAGEQIWEGNIPESVDAISADLFVAETGTLRSRISEWLKLKQVDADITISEAARRLKIDSKTLNATILKAVEEGWLKFEDPLSKVEYQIIPKVIRNLSRLLDEGDKQTTIETAKGTVFKTYQDSKGISDAPKTVLALKIEMPDGENVHRMTGQILGAPRVFVEEVVKNAVESGNGQVEKREAPLGVEIRPASP